LLSAALFGVSPTDPATYALSAAAIVAVAALATFLPARAVIRCDPAQALRAE
jgi:ABC-type antimicrobial peptide transport system permease subunit